MTIRHHLTVDVEEFFHASALEPYISREEWGAFPRHSPALVSEILDRLAAHDVKGTFFVLGWLAEREPEVVKRISEEGHEIASHGWDHRRVNTLSPDMFREDIRRSRILLQDLSGQSIIGYRAPSFSILPGYEWALEVLVEEGFKYDSSLFPVNVHPSYGYPNGERDPYLIRNQVGSLFEFPPATLRIGGLKLPAAGGAYLRFFPLGLVSRALTAAESRGVPGTLYFHPWELDREIPPFTAPWLTQQRLRRGTGEYGKRLSALSARFRFSRMRETVEEMAMNMREKRT